MESMDKWFSREVHQWRTGAAVSWSLIILPAVCVMYVGLTCFQLFSLFSWISDFFSVIFSGSFLLLIFLTLVVNGIFFIYSSRTYVVIPEVGITRLAQFGQLIRVPSLLYLGVCAWTGSVLTWVCTGVLGDRYSTLSYQCAQNSNYYCINERHLFLVMYGGFTGVMYATQHYLHQYNCLQFSPLQQTKYFQVQSRVVPVLQSSISHIVWQIKFFYIIYFFLGSLPADLIADTLSLRFGSEYRLNSLYGLVTDLALLWHALLCGVFIQFSWSIAAMLYKVYNTEHYEFPISSMFDNFKNKCLVDGLSCTSDRLVQALAFFDLNLLSKHSPVRRKELFSLSQPGGHPHNWNNIVSVCLAVLTEFSEKIQDANWKILAAAPLRQGNGDKHGPSGSKVTTVGNGVHIATEGKCQEEKDAQKQPSAKAQMKEKMAGTLKKRPFFHYFLNEVPEARSRQLFASAQLQIWAAEALADLVSASFIEDKYGVVQISLTDILTAVLVLQENVDKHFKLTGGVSRRTQRDQTTSDLPLRYSLQTTLKSSIYKIINTFGKNIMEIRLAPDTEKKLKNFMEYRE